MDAKPHGGMALGLERRLQPLKTARAHGGWCYEQSASQLTAMNGSYEAAALARANEELAEAMLEASALGKQTRRQLQAEQKVKEAEFVYYSSLREQ